MNNYITARGVDITGLVLYLFGKGRFNEHENQRVIAAAETFGFADGTRLDIATDYTEIRALGEQLDSHRRALGVHMRGGHVWHCALSLPADEFLTDQQWAEAARLAIERMGFDESSGKAPCRWIAVHHGKSALGNEHIHLAVNLVREDGTFATTGWERVKMSRVCAELEQRFGMHVVEGRAGAGMPGLSRAEVESTARARKPEPDRIRLARIVRGCATAAGSEAEFVRRLRRQDVAVRPRYASGGRTEVVGYSVALRPRSGAEPAPIWLGGGRLGRDLALPRLREHWTTSPEARKEALVAWSGRAPMANTITYRAEMWEQAASVVDRVRRDLADVPIDDTAAWAGTAREAAGVLSAWSMRLEAYSPGPLAAAADALARSAQTHVGQPHARRVGKTKDLRGVAMLTAAPLSGDGGVAGQLTLMRQLVQLVETIADMHLARGQARRAAALADLARDGLAQIQFHRAWTSGAVPAAPKAAPAARPPGSTPTPGAEFER